MGSGVRTADGSGCIGWGRRKQSGLWDRLPGSPPHCSCTERRAKIDLEFDPPREERAGGDYWARILLLFASCQHGCHSPPILSPLLGTPAAVHGPPEPISVASSSSSLRRSPLPPPDRRLPHRPNHRPPPASAVGGAMSRRRPLRHCHHCVTAPLTSLVQSPPPPTLFIALVPPMAAAAASPLRCHAGP